jgi:hypothetical protein
VFISGVDEFDRRSVHDQEEFRVKKGLICDQTHVEAFIHAAQRFIPGIMPPICLSANGIQRDRMLKLLLQKQLQFFSIPVEKSVVT